MWQEPVNNKSPRICSSHITHDGLLPVYQFLSRRACRHLIPCMPSIIFCGTSWRGLWHGLTASDKAQTVLHQLLAAGSSFCPQIYPRRRNQGSEMDLRVEQTMSPSGENKASNTFMKVHPPPLWECVKTHAQCFSSQGWKSWIFMQFCPYFSTLGHYFVNTTRVGSPNFSGFQATWKITMK